MDSLTRLLDHRTLVIACVLMSATLCLVMIRRALAAYERRFISDVGSSLRQSFIVASPQNLFAAGVLGALIMSAIGYAAMGPAGSALGVVTGLAGPRAALRLIAHRRAKRFVYQLPDALLALASALRAGSNLTKGLELLATRQPAPLRQEFTILLAEHRVGRQLAQSLADMRRRVDAPELDLLNTAVNVSRRVGGNLADTLESLARTLQDKAHMEGKIDALTSMGRAQGWVVGLLPMFIGLVLYRQQPDRMRLLFTEWYGWVVLSVVAIMMALAAWMIRKIVKIDV